MKLKEKQLLIPRIEKNEDLLEYLPNYLHNQLADDEIPIRFVITKTDSEHYYCEVSLFSGLENFPDNSIDSIFQLNKRKLENTEKFNVVLIVPTGIGAEIGGHSGDAGAMAKLIASACDNLITHPNVVNASDLNELPENGLYVEGSVVTRLIMGTVALQKVRSNRLIFIMDKHFDKFFNDSAINSISAARANYGLNCPNIVITDVNIVLKSLYSDSGRAAGAIEDLERVIDICEAFKSEYDAIALSSVIKVPKHFHADYFKNEDMVNPWGGVESMLTHTISLLYNVPSAHSPMMESKDTLNLEPGVVDPRKSAEAVSVTFLNSILKGLQRSPRIITDSDLFYNSDLIHASNISCLIIPDGCVGLPTLAAIEQGIPVIAVKENKNRMENKLEDFPFPHGKLIVVDNYLEAVGVMHALKAGVALDSVRRPIEYSNVIENFSTSDAEEEVKILKTQ